MDSCHDHHELFVEGSTCVDVGVTAVAVTGEKEEAVEEKEEEEASSPSLVAPHLALVPEAASAVSYAASSNSAAAPITPSGTSEMCAEALAPSAELLAAACAPSCLLTAAAQLAATSGVGDGDAEPSDVLATPTAVEVAAGLFASPSLDASAVGFAVALMSLLAAPDSGNGNQNADGLDLVSGLAPWLWSLLPLLRSSPSDDDDQVDFGNQQSQAADVADTATASSSSGIGAGRRKGKPQQKAATAGKDKVGKKNLKASHKEQEQEPGSGKRTGLRRVQFCFVDGSSVQPPVRNERCSQPCTPSHLSYSIPSYLPLMFRISLLSSQGKDCFCGPALRTARRLMALIDQVDALVLGLASELPGQGLAAVLRACQSLAHGPSATALATAITSAFSLGQGRGGPRPGDMAAISRLFASELAAGLALVSCAAAADTSDSTILLMATACDDDGSTTIGCSKMVVTAAPASSMLLSKLSGTRTVLRHRAAWMATAVLRAQLRWLLDPPPQAISISAAAAPSSSSSPNNLQTDNSSGARSRHWCDLHRFVLLKEAIPLPVYVPPPGYNHTLIHIHNNSQSLTTAIDPTQY